MTNRRYFCRWLTVVVAMMLMVAACGGDDEDVTTTAAPAADVTTTTAAPEPVEVSLRLPWFPSAGFSGEYVALAKGFFSDEGLDVTIHPGGFDINSITLVAAGTDTFGLHDTNSLVFASVEEIPLVTVATFVQKHPGAIMALADSGFETLEDLVGATIGFQEGGPWMLTQAMLSKNGIDPDSLEQVAVGFDLTPLFEGDIDLLTVFATEEPITAAAQGFETTVFVPYDYGIETSSSALFTTQSYFADNPDTVCAMVRAIARGWEYALDNKEEAIDIVLAVDPENLEREAQLQVLATVESHIRTPDAIANGLGSMTQQRWQNVVDVLVAYGGLEAEVDLGSVYSDACYTN